MNKKFFSQRFSKRAFAALVLHLVVFGLIYVLAYLLRLEFQMTADDWTLVLTTLPAVLVIKSVVFYAGGHCHRSWHYISFSDLAALLRSSTLGSMALAAYDKFMVAALHESGNFRLSISVLLLDWLLTVLVLGGMRATLRLIREEFRPRFFGDAEQRALIVGANQSGETLARHLMTDRRLRYRVVGFLDDDAQRHGSTIGGLPILGGPSNAVRIATAADVEQLLVISGSLTGQRLRELMTDCSQAELTLKVIPAVDELLTSDYTLQIRDVDINDLLRREPVQLSDDAISQLLAEKIVLVTGAGGSIGSEICRQVAKYQPRRLLLVERAENSLFLIEQEFRRSRPEIEIVPCVADITDRNRMEQLLRDFHPEVVFHAAAHKHVPMMEFNPGEAIKNNVVGTAQLAELADAFGVQEFVMISTDKAVNPTSVMGVSKQIAERFVHAFSEASTTKFVVVRFGNVLASNGSVVPIFQEQIRRGGPVTVTHPEIERFFMTIPEASQLVLQAAAMGKGGEIFVLDMGQPVRIVDLARDLIRLSGLREGDIEIRFTGLRPGEKLYEELYFDEEEMQPTPHSKLFVAYHRPYRLDDVRAMIGSLSKLVHATPEQLRQQIRQWVPEYQSEQMETQRKQSGQRPQASHSLEPAAANAEPEVRSTAAAK